MTTPGRPVLDEEAKTPDNPEGCIGQDCSGHEVYGEFTLTVGQLKNLFVAHVLVNGNYADTRKKLSELKAALAKEAE
jgi:hypothetical protein